jgi:hypothetical protein
MAATNAGFVNINSDLGESFGRPVELNITTLIPLELASWVVVNRCRITPARNAAVVPYAADLATIIAAPAWQPRSPSST